jgi:hypothetical protein
VDNLRRGDTIRLKEPKGVPPKLHGEEVEVAEIEQIGLNSYAVRIRDPNEWDGPTERDPDEFAQRNVHCPHTVLPKDFEVIDDET